MKKIIFLFLLISSIVLGIVFCFDLCKKSKIEDYNRYTEYIELYEKNQNRYNFSMNDIIKYNNYKKYIKDFTLKNNYKENLSTALMGIVLGTFAFAGIFVIYKICDVSYDKPKSKRRKFND